MKAARSLFNRTVINSWMTKEITVVPSFFKSSKLKIEPNET